LDLFYIRSANDGELFPISALFAGVNPPLGTRGHRRRLRPNPAERRPIRRRGIRRDHHFSWASGRKLDALQILLIEGGSGEFESKPTGPKVIEPHAVFIVCPGVWHRYRPNPQTGWRENWLELQGPLVERLRRHNLLSPRKAVATAHEITGLDRTFSEIHHLLRSPGTVFNPELSALALRVLALWVNWGRQTTLLDPATRIVAEVEAWLTEHMGESIDLVKLARQFGMSYSNFRRVFKDLTGMSPWQYLLQLRLAKARRLFVNDGMTLTQIAERLGFNNGFHLSAAFKSYYGKSPMQWKNELRRRADL